MLAACDATLIASGTATRPRFVVQSLGRSGSTLLTDLLAALDSGQIGAATLDAFTQEPLPADLTDALGAWWAGEGYDLRKLAMLAVQQLLDAEARATRIVMQVHDELVFEVPESELEWARVAVPQAMASVATLKVPLLAEVGVGPNWDEAH